MTKVRMELGDRSYDIVIRPGVLDSMKPHMREARKCLVVADRNVAARYLDKVTARLTESGAVPFTHILAPGEKHKTFAAVEGICRAAAQAGLERKSLIVGLGGGVTGDLAGFAAAIYMRGIGFLQIPTSLLAMVDSSVGGKTGADLPEGKNLIGAFYQPEMVIIDPNVLNTLPVGEKRNGLAEIIKYGVIMDYTFFADLEASKANVTPDVIAHCCRLKAEVVSADETEQGRRAILNYGHTFGHAIELLSGFKLSHGEGVAIGMGMAAAMSTRNNLWNKEEEKRQNDLLLTAGLPFRVGGFKPEDILAAMYHDKKKAHGKLTLVLPVEIGRVELFKDFSDEEILKAIRSCCD
jgi:3-dehydroquinate synthase